MRKSYSVYTDVLPRGLAESVVDALTLTHDSFSVASHFIGRHCSVSGLVMSLRKSVMVAFVLLVPSLISYCARTANGQIDGGAIGSCNQNCTFYDNGTSSRCNGNCSCISDNYYMRTPQNPAGPGKCYQIQISPKVATGNL
uniref:8 kDa Amblyomma family member n=1 Tax=Rhipicephalus zambeziensis TaxID=60191 RepID=A0A224YBA5_9ACAR